MYEYRDRSRFGIKIIFTTLVVLVAFFGASHFRDLWRRHNVKPPEPRPEVNLTIIPGWNLRQVADYLVMEGFASNTEAVYAVTRKPAVDYRMVVSDNPSLEAAYASTTPWFAVPYFLSYEGFLAPETYRVYTDATVEEIIEKLNDQRKKEITESIGSGPFSRPWLDILTMASIIEKETRHPEDRAIVSDILWRRLDRGVPLQVDSSVHYAVDKTGDVFTTDKERSVDSPWNTYKYRGLPPSPICNPSIESIKAALNPKKNGYWYFLTGRDGTMYYAKDLDGHNRNKKYL